MASPFEGSTTINSSNAPEGAPKSTRGFVPKFLPSRKRRPSERSACARVITGREGTVASTGMLETQATRTIRVTAKSFSAFLEDAWFPETLMAQPPQPNFEQSQG